MNHRKPAHAPTDETPQDVRFHRLNWAVSTVARMLFLAIVLAAALGLFGRGLVSGATARAGGVELTHERFVREAGRFGIRLTPESDQVTVVLRGLVDPRDKCEFAPEPSSDTLGAGARRLVFDVEPGQEAAIEVKWQPNTPGVHRGSVQVQGQTFEVWAMVYP